MHPQKVVGLWISLRSGDSENDRTASTHVDAVVHSYVTLPSHKGQIGSKTVPEPWISGLVSISPPLLP